MWDRVRVDPVVGSTAGAPRRRVRYLLRDLLREVSTLPRCLDCGMSLGASRVAVKLNAEVAHYAGLATCGSVWACPVCAAKIRVGRADEASRGLCNAITVGGGALLVTLTMRHEAADKLARTIELVSEGFRSVQMGKAWMTERRYFGIFGHIRSFEVTHGCHGWHPHLHIVLVLEAPLTTTAVEGLRVAWQRRWDSFMVKNGWPRTEDGIGVRVDAVHRNAAAVGAYVAKLQEGGGLGNELARADLKGGRAGSRTPFEILAAFGTNGEATDLELWHEYEAATKGRSAIRWSKGLRARLLVNEPEATDEELAAADAGGDLVAMIEPWLWRRVAKIPGASVSLLEAVERGGFAGLLATLTAYRLDPAGVLRADTDQVSSV